MKCTDGLFLEATDITSISWWQDNPVWNDKKSEKRKKSKKKKTLLKKWTLNFEMKLKLISALFLCGVVPNSTSGNTSALNWLNVLATVIFKPTIPLQGVKFKPI